MAATPLTDLKGVGPALAKKLEKLGLSAVEDLLFLLPLRYEDRTQLVRIGSLAAGTRCLVTGEVLLAEVAYRGRRNLLVRISDGSGQLTLRFFHFSRQQQAQFQPGMQVSCFGEVRRGSSGFEMIHPEYRVLRESHATAMSDSLTPIYPATEGVQQGRLRNLTDQALRLMQRQPPVELLPTDIRHKLGMPSLADAIRYLHRPPPDADVEQLTEGRHPCQQRLAFEELLAHYLSLRNQRAMAETENAIALTGGQGQVDAFINSLPFQLTGAQARVVDEILTDLGNPHPMMRLVQGDVGSGKTVVAAIACLKAIACGVQVAIMAPTEILAEQHWRNFSAWFQPLGIEPAWLSGSQKAAARRHALEAIADGSAGLVVGTHALFQEGVEFQRLALVVIDEQHRFGVHQRLALRDKGNKPDQCPHQLIMTATPIPRTLAMAAYADLDTSVIDELPPGRKPVQTVALNQSRREEVMSRVRQACAGGSQVYWVCTLIEESDVLECQAAADTAALLASQMPELRIGLVHGRLKPGEKEQVMDAFKHGVLDLLVATTVIEVGVDVRNANLMIIENAERLGLSQLHQLRGRIGRGDQQGSCVLMYQGPLSAQARQRLDTLRRTTDGFEIARCDLDLRGPGDVLGTRQTGELRFRIADLLRDEHLLEAVEDVSRHLLERHPDAARPLIQRWLGKAERYADV